MQELSSTFEEKPPPEAEVAENEGKPDKKKKKKKKNNAGKRKHDDDDDGSAAVADDNDDDEADVDDQKRNRYLRTRFMNAKATLKFTAPFIRKNNISGKCAYEGIINMIFVFCIYVKHSNFIYKTKQLYVFILYIYNILIINQYTYIYTIFFHIYTYILGFSLFLLHTVSCVCMYVLQYINIYGAIYKT